jgi:hypothetical protein
MSTEEYYVPPEILIFIFNIFDRDQKSSYPKLNLRLVCKEWANSIDDVKNQTGKINLFWDKKKIETIPENITTLQVSFEKSSCIKWDSYFTSPLPNITNLSFIINELYNCEYVWSPRTPLFPEKIRNIYPNISKIIITHNIRNHLGFVIASVEAIFPKDEGKIFHLSIRSSGGFLYKIKGPKYCDMKWTTVDRVTIEGSNDLKDTTFNLPELKELNLSVPYNHEDEKIISDKLPGIKVNNLTSD